VQSPDSEGFLKNIIHEERGQAFLLEKDGYTVLVKNSGAKVILRKTTKVSSDMFKKASPELKAYLAGHMKGTKFLGVKKSFSLQEGLLKDGDKVAIVGACKWVLKTYSSRKILELGANENTALHICNFPKTVN